MTVAGIAALIELSTAALLMITKLVFAIQDLIAKSDFSQEDKDELIARIKKAQASIPEWK